jgi:mannose-1-phosphate guanylyltransferase/phosphomannomutase
MKTFVLCGGEGTRLRPYTYETPKPMMKVGGKPILQYVIENLKEHGLTDLVLTVGYLKEKITEYFGGGSKFGVKIEYAIEDTPKNTAGSILEYRGKIKETFVVVMGDHLTNIDMKKMIEFHKKQKGNATLALLKQEIALEYGVANVEDNKILSFEEKPKIEKLVNTAIYVFEPKVFDYIGEKEDFAKNVFPKMMKAKEKLNAYIFEEVWYDVGRVSDYEKIKEKFDGNFTKLESLLKQ